MGCDLRTQKTYENVQENNAVPALFARTLSSTRFIFRLIPWSESRAARVREDRRRTLLADIFTLFMGNHRFPSKLIRIVIPLSHVPRGLTYRMGCRTSVVRVGAGVA